MSELDEILRAFVEESLELLSKAEDFLLTLESDPKNSEALNGLFRSVHTIKGTAGMFGFDWIVHFTHVVENLLEKLRSYEIELTPPVIEILFQSRDHIVKIVKIHSKENLDEDTIQKGKLILESLETYLNRHPSRKQSPSDEKFETDLKETTLHPQTDFRFQNPNYHISLRLHPHTFLNALDPSSFIRYLNEIGTIQFVRTIIRSLPEWNDFNPEHCYLGFEISFSFAGSPQEVQKVFEFLEFDSKVAILSPNPSLEEVKAHIASLPEDEIFLSNLYMEMGVLDRDELILLLESFQGVLTYRKANRASSETEGKREIHPPLQQVDPFHEASSSSLRVDSSRIDYLINKVGELVVAEATLSQLFSQSEDTAVLEALNATSRLVHEIREISLKLRMVPIGDSFQKYHRIVRDLGRELGKKVKLQIRGGDTELDKTVMERLSDPMVHLVRNAIDHSLEFPEERIALGKEETGTILLNAFHDTGTIVIEISDDGRGINHEKVLARAREKGIAKLDETYSDEEIERFLFFPGFSTADQVSNISGRGVGLDVVLKNIESLRGSIQIQTAKNKGTKFIFRLPLTLAIIDGFLVGSGEDLYVLPLDMVRECVEFREELPTSEDSSRFFNLRGSILPYVRLDEFFYGISIPSPRKNIVVTEFLGNRFGLVVDKLYGELQTVIKPLAKVFENIRGIGGSTTLGDGRIALILDVPDLHLSLKAKEEIQKKELYVDI